MTKFLGGFVAIATVGVWSSLASATTLLYEPFDYTSGQSITGKTDIYTTPNQTWQLAGATDLHVVGSGSLVSPFASSVPPSIGNDANLTKSGTSAGYDRLTIPGQPYGPTNSTLYYSLLLDVPSITGLTIAHTNLNANNDGLIAFNNSTGAQTGAPSIWNGELVIRLGSTAGTYNLGIRATASTNNTTYFTGDLTPGTTNFIVVQASLGANQLSGTDDLNSIWLNPQPNTFGLSESNRPAPDGSTDGGLGNNNSMQSLIIGAGIATSGAAPNTTLIDEIRVGTTWADVTPTKTFYWDTDNTIDGAGGGGSPTGIWNDSAATWTESTTGATGTNTSWGSGGNAVFSAGSDATGAYTVTVSGPKTVKSMTFKNGTPTVTSATINDTINLTSGAITLDSNAATITATIGSVITGGSGLNVIKSGPATNGAALVLTGNNTYTGATTIGSGVALNVGDGTTNGSLPAASVITNNGALVFIRSDTVTQGPLGNFDTTGAGMSGAGNLVQAGNGNLVLPVSNTYSGTTKATAGTLTIKHATAVQNSIVITDAGGSIVFDPSLGGQNVTVGGLSSAGTTYTAPSNMSLTINKVNDAISPTIYAGNMGGTGTLTKTGAFAQTLSGTNNYSGATTINLGALEFGQKASMSANSAITVNGQSAWTPTLTKVTGGVLSVYSDDGSSGTMWNVSGSGAGTITGLINGAGGQGTINWQPGSSLGIHIEPNTGDSNTGITYSGAIGNFATVTTSPTGDYNHNGVVDAADYPLQRKLGLDYNAWRSNFGATGGGAGTTNNIGLTKRGYGTLTLSGANTYNGELRVDDEGGTLRLTSVQTNAGQSMSLPTVYVGNAVNTTPTILKILVNDAIPASTDPLILFGSGVNGGINPIFRLHDADPPTVATIPSQSFNQTVRGFSGGNGLVQVGAGTLTINTPTNESYSYTGTIRTDYDAVGAVDTVNPVNNRQHGTIIKTGAGRQDFTQIDGNMKGEFILQQGTVGIGQGQVFGSNVPVQDPNNNNANLNWPRLTINGGTLMNSSNSSLTMAVPNLFIGGSFTFDVVAGSNTTFSGGTNHTLTTLTASPTITVTAGTGGVLVLPYTIQDDGTPRGITKSGPGALTLGGHDNSYRGDTIVQQGELRANTGAGSDANEVAALGDQTNPGRIVMAGGTLAMNGQAGTLFASGCTICGSYSGTRTNVENNPVHVDAPNDNSAIAYSSTTTGVTGDVNFIFTSNSVDWNNGALTFVHKGSSATATYRPTFTGTGFNYAGRVVISNDTSNAGKTVLQSANTTGTQTWSGVIADPDATPSHAGSFRRTAAGGETDFTAANTFTGGAFVDDGTLKVTGANATFGGGNLTVGGTTDGHAVIDSGVSNAIADTATLTLLGGGASNVADIGYINLGAGISEHVAHLILGSTAEPAGTYNATTSPEYISGTGQIIVNVGGGAGSSLGTSAVPEPASLALVLLATSPFFALRRRYGRR